MLWEDKTFWLKTLPQKTPEHAFVSDVDAEELPQLLGIDGSKSVIEPVKDCDPCKSCPQQKACMGSAWADGKRMGGPTAGAGVSEVIFCLFCMKPALVFHRQGTEKAIPDNCPRRTEQMGECDGCQKLRAKKLPSYDLSVETRSKVRTVIHIILEDPSFADTWTGLPTEEQDSLMRRWEYALWDSITDGPDVALRALVISMTEGPLERAWLAKSLGTRKFALRCWEGVVRKVCTE